jgi:hypothetical protein
MGVETGHGVADDVRALAVRSIGAQAHLLHRVEDASLHWLQTVAHVGDGARGDHRKRVGEERLAHLLRHRRVDDLAGERVQRKLFGHGSVFSTWVIGEG